MICGPLNQEEIRNRLSTKTRSYTTVSETLEESVKRIKEFANAVKESYKNGERFRTIGGVPVDATPSTIAQKKYGPKVESFTEEQEKKGDYMQKNGIEVHSELGENILPAIFKGEKPKKTSDKIKDADFETLTGTGRAIYQWAKKKQEAIDPNGKFTLLPEQLVGSTLNPMTGRADAIIVFSNGRAAIIDFKTTAIKHNYLNKKGELASDDFFMGKKKKQYDYQIREYKVMLEDNYGIKVDETFLVPVILTLTEKGNISKIRSYQKNDEAEDKYLSFLPAISSTTGVPTLDRMLKKIQDRIKTLEKRKGKEDQKKANILRRQFKSLSIDKDLTASANVLNTLQVEVAKLKGLETFTNENINTLEEMRSEVKIYTNLPALYKDVVGFHNNAEELKRMVSEVDTNAEYLLNEIDSILTEIAMNNSFYEKDINTDKTSVKMTRSLSYLAKKTLGYNSIDNPYVRALMKVVNEMNALHNFEVNKTKERILKAERAALKKVGSSEKLYSYLIDKKRGKLHKMMSEEYWEMLNKLTKLPVEQRGLKIKEMFRIKNEAAYRENYQKERKEYLVWLDKEIASLGFKSKAAANAAYRTRLDIWESHNDLLGNVSAWANKKTRFQHLEIKPEIKEKYLSEEYRKIQSVPEVLAYYQMWSEEMEEIRKMLNLDYNTVGNTMIPWFRKDLWDAFSQGIGAVPKEIWKSMTTVREGDIDMHNYNDKEGNERVVPILGITPFLDKNNKAMVDQKSYDLTKSLLMFTDMAYKAKFAMDAEGAALTILELHERDGVDKYLQKGERHKDYTGDAQKNLLEYKHIQELLNAALETEIYSIYTTDLKDSPKLAKSFKSAVEWNAKRILGLAVVPAVAGGVAAYLQLRAIENSEKYWSKEQGKVGDKLILKLIQDGVAGKKTKPGAFIKGMDVLIESSVEKDINQANPTFFKKYFNTRSLFAIFRTSDEAVDMKIALSAAQNYGFDQDGNLFRLESLPEGTPSVYDLFEFDEAKGEYSLEKFGATDKEKALKLGQFRTMIGNVQYRVKGSMARGESAAYQQSLMLGALSQFKTWMPGVVLERFEKTNYNVHTDTVNTGRYTSFGALSQIGEVGDGEIKFVKEFIAKTKVAAHLMYKMMNRKHLISKTEEGKASLKMSFERLSKDTQDYFIGSSGSIEHGVEEYGKHLERQMVAMASELKYIMLSAIAFLAMGMAYAGEDDREETVIGWVMRQIYKFLRKLGLELRFSYNPLEILSLSQDFMPVISLFDTILDFLGNTADEGRDWIFGENSKQDKSDPFHYFSLLLFGGRQFRQTADFIWEGDKKLPN